MSRIKEKTGIEIIYEDNHLIAVNKPSGYLVQGDQTGDKPISEFVKEYIKIRYNKPGDVFLGVIHRIDRPVSGVVVFARTSKALTRMNELFLKKQVQKTYLAITNSRPEWESETLIHYIEKDEETNIAKAYDSVSKKHPNAKYSELTYSLLRFADGHALLEIKPKTGRPHQIRVQLSKINCSIKGDLKYGAIAANPDMSICLHAKSIEFEHPVTKVMIKIEAPIPKTPLWSEYRNL